MPSLENHIDRTLGEARECLTAQEITDRLNQEGGRMASPYTVGEIQGKLDAMPNIRKAGKKYCRKREDASQAAVRVVREATKD
jgi:hypothetical protein